MSFVVVGGWVLALAAVTDVLVWDPLLLTVLISVSASALTGRTL